jgi:altronate hydrolase
VRERLLQIDAKDNVLIALADLKKDSQVTFNGRSCALQTDVPAKHKFAVQDLAPGDPIVMYGVLVGKAVTAIRQGEVITTRNIHHDVASFHEYREPYRWHAPGVSKWQQRSFLGYRRADGQVGTRNYWIVLPLVFCENRNLAVLKQAFEEELGFAAPQPYRRQVAELVRLSREGKTQVLE